MGIALSVQRTIAPQPLVEAKTESLRDAALGGALSQHRLLRALLTVLALMGTFALLVIREVGLVNALDLGRLQPAPLSVTEPASVTWTEVALPDLKGLPVSMVYDPAQGEFQVTTDSGEFLRLTAATGALQRARLPFFPGPDLPIVLQPALGRNHWPSTDGAHGFFITQDNELATVALRSMKVTRTQPLLERTSAPRPFKSEACFWHVAYDTASDRLVLVVRDRADASILTTVQFEEPKRGFGTILHFAVDGDSGRMSYAIDGVHGLQELSFTEGGTLERKACLLPPAPFPSGSTTPSAVWQLPIRRIAQLSYGKSTWIAKVPGELTAALRPDAPMVSFIPATAEREPWNYFPAFDAMPPNGMVPLAHGILLVGRQQPAEGGGAVEALGIELIDWEQRTVLRASDFNSAAVRVPSAVATQPMLAASPDGQFVAVAGRGVNSVWIGRIQEQGFTPAGGATSTTSVE